MKLIVNLICQNSEPELPALLKSLEGRVDGLVAVDGGSTDRTVELLNAWSQTAGIPVVCKKNAWQDDFGGSEEEIKDAMTTLKPPHAPTSLSRYSC